MACEYALGFGCQLEVLDPPSLREQVVAAAKRVVEFYRPKLPTDYTEWKTRRQAQ
jgi:hypothetical protein